MNRKLETALDILTNEKDNIWFARNEAIIAIKGILLPCGESGCLIGTEDYCDDIFYVRAEPEPNKMRFVTRIRYVDDKLDVQLAQRNGGELIPEGWIPFEQAHIDDVLFLLEEISNNLEYADGYQDE